MLLFTEPMAQKPVAVVPARKALVRPAISMGSPSGVPVPCASRQEMESGSTLAFACAIAITSAWPSMLGAV